MREATDGSKGILHQNGWMNGEMFFGDVTACAKKDLLFS